LVIFQRLVQVTAGMADLADVVQSGRLKGPVPDRVDDRQCLLVVLHRWVEFTAGVVDPANIVQRAGFVIAT
jgi:hypothetical protein